MRAFVNHVQAVVAPVLLDREIARVAIATMDLDGERIGLQAPFAGPAFGNGGEDLQQQACVICSGSVCGVLLVHQASAIQFQCQGAFAVALLREQHAFDIAVLDDTHLGGGAVFATCAQGAALRAILGVFQTGLVTCHAQHDGGSAYAYAGFVHHVKHAGQSLSDLANEVAHRTGLAVNLELAFTKVQQGIGGATPAAFVVKPCQGHVVAHAGELALGIDHFLRDDEQ